ncbi:winged helix-turn-helix transcriptional regulator [Streptomyces sp. ISL-96]|uniref:winged helix-turn-helix domain-containing protein n=1 Tax=Streptomyces sp. ISL-96 TaxID=2819191 RepID=UPI001BE89F96|nr:winged helix-turn-helix domain-containing protein [Streptomyces sp. ISL-96]MBT2489393.1 winged helix-turn-helix transcriptional regulator [Streptomyces sp. ISL-96]
MANTRTFSAAAPSQSPAPLGRHRLRAVDRDEAVRNGRALDVADFLPPGATWLPAPPHTLPTLPGRPPMTGYLVLVPADQQPAVAPPTAAGEDESSADGPVRIDGAQRAATVDGRTLDLTYLEFELLAHLVAHPNRVHTRDQLVTTVWGYGHVGDGRTVDVHIARLRRKLGAEHRGTIQTVRRVGYKYSVPGR